jgi:hypothetical protein
MHPSLDHIAIAETFGYDVAHFASGGSSVGVGVGSSRGHQLRRNLDRLVALPGLAEHVHRARHRAEDRDHVRGIGSGMGEDGDSTFKGHGVVSVGRRGCCLASAVKRTIGAMKNEWTKNPALTVFRFVLVIACSGEGVHWGLKKLNEGGTEEPWWVWSILLSAGVPFWLLMTVKAQIVELTERAR